MLKDPDTLLGIKKLAKLSNTKLLYRKNKDFNEIQAFKVLSLFYKAQFPKMFWNNYVWVFVIPDVF